MQQFHLSLIGLFLLCLSLPAWGQDGADSLMGNFFVVVDEMPSFPGGREAMDEYLFENMQNPYPQSCISGKTYVRFIVEKDGSLSYAHVVRGIGEAYDKEALRLVHEMPVWKPGLKEGEVVRVQYTIPVEFGIY